MVTTSVGGSRLSSQVEGTANNKPGNTPPVVEASDPEKVDTRPKRKGRRRGGFLRTGSGWTWSRGEAKTPANLGQPISGATRGAVAKRLATPP